MCFLFISECTKQGLEIDPVSEGMPSVSKYEHGCGGGVDESTTLKEKNCLKNHYKNVEP